jgi:hypothetical protein
LFFDTGTSVFEASGTHIRAGLHGVERHAVIVGDTTRRGLGDRSIAGSSSPPCFGFEENVTLTKNVFLNVAGGFALAGLVVTAIGCGSPAPTTNTTNANAPAKPVATTNAPAPAANANSAAPAVTNAPAATNAATTKPGEPAKPATTAPASTDKKN